MSVALAADQRLPIYQRLKDALVERITVGEWRAGDLLPAETQLAADYQVALGTVRKALEGLVGDGVLERQQGRGTYVRRPDFGNALFRFFRLTDAAGTVVQPQARILDRWVAPAAGLAPRLEIAADAAVLHLFRERTVNAVPILVEEIAVAADRFLPLIELPADAFGDLLYPLYDQRCGQTVVRARETIRFGHATPRIATALGCTDSTPLAIIERTAFGRDGGVLEWRRSFGPADQFNYTIDLK